MTTRDEIMEQGKALSAMHGDVLENIHSYAEDFRAIITDYEKEFGVPPSAADLLWIASEHAGFDITK